MYDLICYICILKSCSLRLLLLGFIAVVSIEMIAPHCASGETVSNQPSGLSAGSTESAPEQNLPVRHEQARAVIDTRTTFSDGAYDPETLVQMARERGISIVFLNDHDRMAMEYGLPPFRGILKKRVELNSINKMGADKYLAEVAGIRKKYPDMVIIPGAESAPFYYWTGNPFTGSLTAHDHERRILTVGLEKADDYKTLLVAHTDGVGIAIFQTWSTAVIIVSLLLSIYLLFSKGRWRLAGGFLMAANFLFILNAFLSTSSLFDAYHGPKGAKPYQHFIDAVNQKGGLTFWNYPETKSGVRKMGLIYVNTPPYPQMLLETINYTGFAALYGENITATEPGGLWDKALQEYCMGFRRTPPWGIATSDYHEEGESGQKLGDFQTVFLLSEYSNAAVLDALKQGRIYACQGNFPRMPRLEKFAVSDSENEGVRPAVSGEELVVKRNPHIRVAVSGHPNSREFVRVRLICSGELIKVFSGKLPLEIDYVDNPSRKRRKIYYRVDMKGYGAIVSNPIFVRFKK